MTRKKQLRTRKLIDKSLQFRLVGAFVAVGCVATLFQVVLLNQSMLSLSKNLSANGDLLLQQTPPILVRSVLITLCVLVPAMTLVGILVTHRIAGPAYRMRMHLKEIEESGEVPRACRIRKHDELHEMCELLNRAIDRLTQGPQTEDSSDQEERHAALEAAPSLTPGANQEACESSDANQGGYAK